MNNGINNQEARLDFYRRLKEDHFPYSPMLMDTALEAYSYNNEYARAKLAQRRGADVGIGQSEAATAVATSDFYQSCADATDVVGDVVTGGAHRNLQKAAEEFHKGNYAKAAGRGLAAFTQVAVTAGTSVLGEMAESGKLTQKLSGLGNWKRSQQIVSAVSTLKVAPKLKPLAVGGWKLVQKYAPKALEAYRQAKKAETPVHKWVSAVAEWGGAVQNQLAKGNQPAAMRYLQKQLTTHQPHSSIHRMG